jgi:hypothetical protein
MNLIENGLEVSLFQTKKFKNKKNNFIKENCVISAKGLLE